VLCRSSGARPGRGRVQRVLTAVAVCTVGWMPLPGASPPQYRLLFSSFGRSTLAPRVYKRINRLLFACEPVQYYAHNTFLSRPHANLPGPKGTSPIARLVGSPHITFTMSSCSFHVMSLFDSWMRLACGNEWLSSFRLFLWIIIILVFWQT